MCDYKVKCSFCDALNAPTLDGVMTYEEASVRAQAYGQGYAQAMNDAADKFRELLTRST
jgi:5,10-methenyltetrahydromethanopterin hydrogenase